MTSNMVSAPWETIRNRKLEEQRSRIPQEWLIPTDKLPSDDIQNVMDIPRTCGILSAREINITETHDARSLATAIRIRKYTAVEVTTAFCKRATVCNQLTSCLTEPLFSSALARARDLDAHLLRTGSPIGPLHGLPISIKDTFHIAGVDSTVGIAALAFHPAASNAPIVDTLLAAGAIIHCKTNVPQTMLALDSVNNIYGRTLNPRNRKRWTAGGSSGGEGVLVAMRGSVMGVGTDVGGSVRIPAFTNGIVGFKPSEGRISIKGTSTGQPDAGGQVGLQAVVGPIARTLDDVSLFMEAVEGGRMWDVDPDIKREKGWWSRHPCIGTLQSRISQNPGKEEGGIRIGIIFNDGNTAPLPPVARMMHTLSRRLLQTRKNVQIIPIDPLTSGFSACQSLANKFFAAEGGAHLLSLLSSTREPIIPWLEGRLRAREPATLDRFRELCAERDALRTRLLESVWRDKNNGGLLLDFLLCPVAPHPVPPVDRWGVIGYTSSFVLLDWVVGVLPLGVVGEEDVVERQVEGEERGHGDKMNRTLWADGDVRRGWVGAPMGVQVVGLRGEERRVWEAMKVVEGVVGGGERVERRKEKL
ncbi:MAG: hypothetical protein Q9220_000906 [cf. Caloplaca sp. 1 TL-2023]